MLPPLHDSCAEGASETLAGYGHDFGADRTTAGTEPTGTTRTPETLINAQEDGDIRADNAYNYAAISNGTSTERVNQAVLQDLRLNAIKARWDQPPLGFDSSRSDGYTLTHADTTEYSDSVYGGHNHAGPSGRPLEDGEEDDEGQPQKKKRKMAAPSVYSYNSTRDISQFVKDVNGRKFNTLNDSYLLPNDEDEWSRLDRQHVALSIAMGGPTPAQSVVDAVLAPEDGVRKRILDIGCGSGVWAIEMARKYPHASVTGVDLAPTPFDPSLFPPNLTFEIDDVNHGLGHFADQFDLIHVRCATIGMSDFDRTMREIQLCLKPGGLAVIVEGDINLYSEDRLHAVKIPDVLGEGPNSKGSWFRKMVWEANRANNIAGARPERAAELIDLGFWPHDELVDPETAMGGHVFLPIGPWPKVPDALQTQQLGYAGALIRQGFMNLHRGYHGILSRHGLDPQLLESWSKKVDTELGEMTIKLWVRFRFCWARRRAGPGLPAPPLPSIPTPSTSTSGPNPNINTSTNTNPTSSSTNGQAQISLSEGNAKIPYPYLMFFKTAEEAATALQQRRNAVPPYPASELEKAWALKELEREGRSRAGAETS